MTDTNPQQSSTDQPIGILLPRVMRDIGAVEKRMRNEGQHFNFRGVDDTMNAAHKALTAHNVIVVPEVLDIQSAPVTTKSGNTAHRVQLLVKYRFTGPQLDSIDAVVASEAIDYGDKATSKAMSMALKYALFQTLMIPTEDTDPDAESYEVANGRISHDEHAEIIQHFSLITDDDARTAAKLEFVNLFGQPLDMEASGMGAFRDWAGKEEKETASG
jgi:hypothetical protein